jgi:glutamyl-tRNA synthetase
MQAGLMAKALPFLKKSAKTFPELLEKASFLMVSRPIVADAQSAASLDAVSRGILKSLTPRLQSASWTKEALEPILTQAAADNGLGFGKLAAPLRAAIAGKSVTPSVYDMMLVIGQDETVARLKDASV